jgi:hypothetical protein
VLKLPAGATSQIVLPFIGLRGVVDDMAAQRRRRNFKEAEAFGAAQR